MTNHRLHTLNYHRFQVGLDVSPYMPSHAQFIQLLLTTVVKTLSSDASQAFFDSIMPFRKT